MAVVTNLLEVVGKPSRTQAATYRMNPYLIPSVCTIRITNMLPDSQCIAVRQDTGAIIGQGQADADGKASFSMEFYGTVMGIVRVRKVGYLPVEAVAPITSKGLDVYIQQVEDTIYQA